MAVATARHHLWTPEEYTAFENQSPTKHEYLDGEIFAMAGARPTHNRTCSRAGWALETLVNGGRCAGFNSDQRIYIPATGLYTYPDGGVACGDWQIHEDGMGLLNPTLLFEVLSPSTREYDLGAKRQHYQQIPSLRHILLLDPETKHVWHYHRNENEAWQLTELADGEIALPDLGGNIPVATLFPS